MCGRLYMFNELRWEVIVRFVDIGEIVKHHCLNFFSRYSLT
jgi:hypothetical protein